ncbi:alpha/beta-hydrolase [Lindgomyces ingoldianus]|uniref:Alpha/beta-hydrolase n=1 Tax=Lindgomyces ingoldianus TaxID=673940 RepID=A0ACB6QW58_9PLEO|nr:alpha/beta-hydrolase [Lindgomyces ingoldianus]KAF2471238.1 alpha/beta-hydrolase [Lindgomyces ingoldianus]
MTGIVTPDNVVQFRAVPYATIPSRFQQSVLLNDLFSTSRDFTKPGFACPHTLATDAVGGGPFPNEPASSDFPTSEFGCLILQINVPLSYLEGDSAKFPSLPVVVYIHGGGFVLGKIDQQHNTAYIVEQSINDDQPIIAVNLQYRLGALGYLATPGGANLALYDQRNALLWIQKFMVGFGGDPSRVTVFGESAGSMSICYQMLCSPPTSGPLFSRAILMSGIIGPMTAPMPLREAEKLYEKFLDALEIQERGELAYQKMKTLDVQHIVDVSSKLSAEGVMWIPVQSEEWFGKDKGVVTWDRIPELLGECNWVDEVVLGTTGFEGTTFISALQSLTPSNFTTAIAEQLGDENASSLLQAVCPTVSTPNSTVLQYTDFGHVRTYRASTQYTVLYVRLLY